MLKNRLKQGFMAIALTLIIASCTKEPDLVGLDLLPQTDRLEMGFTDTSTIVAYSIRESGVLTDELSQSLLGYIQDSVFGNTLASIYTQYRTPSNNLSFGTNPVVDSMVLTLVYSGIYGDSVSPHKVKVFELADDILLESDYYFDNTLAILPNQIGEATFIPNLKDPDTIGNLPPHMRVVLSTEFANKIITATDTVLSSNKFFQEVFKGIYITADPSSTAGPGSMLYFDLMNAGSRMKLYYHNDSDTSSVEFLINTVCARFNHYNHFNFENADPQLLQQFSGDTTSGGSRVFLQAMGGSKVKLRIPYIKDIPNTAKIAVNEALLIITDNAPGSIFAPPSQLALRALDSEGEYKMLPEELIGSSYFGGNYVNGKEYHFRITKYVQDRMKNPDVPDYGLMLITVGSALTGNRVVLNGPESETGRMKLKLTYTVVE